MISNGGMARDKLTLLSNLIEALTFYPPIEAQEPARLDETVKGPWLLVNAVG